MATPYNFVNKGDMKMHQVVCPNAFEWLFMVGF
jgi:hypothetical protein